MATLYSRHPNRDRPTRQSQSECHIVRKMIQVPLSRVSRHLGLCFGVHRREHGGLDLRCNLACLCRSRITPLLAASASAVGMWATRCVVQAKRHIHSPRRRLDLVDAGAPHQYFRRMFLQSGRRLGVVTIAGPMFRMPEERMLQMGSSLMATAAEIAEASGAPSPFLVKAA